ncbi:MAG: hypothetical protein ACKVZJ_03610 [Phycisphaerales bacterium]
MATPATTRLIGPLLAGSAALFAGGVWLIPGRVLTPDASPQAPAAPIPTKPAYVPPPKETRWPELAAKLEGLREPWKGPDPALATQPDQPAAVPESMLSWEYVGLVETAKLRAAIVVVNNAQRFVSAGEVVSDPSFPGATLRVKSIEAEQLEVEHVSDGSRPNGKERISTVQRKKPTPATVTPAFSRGPETMPGGGPGGIPGMNSTPGLTTGGGRGIVQPPMPGSGKPRPVAPPGTAFPTSPGATPQPVYKVPPTPGAPPQPQPPTYPPGSAPSK